VTPQSSTAFRALGLWSSLTIAVLGAALYVAFRQRVSGVVAFLLAVGFVVAVVLLLGLIRPLLAKSWTTSSVKAVGTTVEAAPFVRILIRLAPAVIAITGAFSPALIQLLIFIAIVLIFVPLILLVVLFSRSDEPTRRLVELIRALTASGIVHPTGSAEHRRARIVLSTSLPMGRAQRNVQLLAL
jgi:hypothetical protein